MSTLPLLIEILRDPASASRLNPVEWDLLIRQARHANLLGRLHYLLLDDAKCMVPVQAQRHLLAGRRLSERQQASVRWEAFQIRDALASAGVQAVLLKGTAYVLSGRDAARGRVFADVDILVPHAQLAQAEAALMLHGWVSAEQDAYNQRYYREWMHELPPMQHLKRGSVIDVHHSILPPTARTHPDPVALVADAQPLAEVPGLSVLAPADMFLHSATHLFFEGEGDNTLRDLVDLQAMLGEFSATEADFLDKVLARARHHQLEAVLALALRYLDKVLAVRIPAHVSAALLAYTPQGRRALLLDAMYARILTPLHRSTKDAWTPLAREALYIRAHWLRMPPRLLLQHLLRKAWKRLAGEADNPVTAPQDAP